MANPNPKPIPNLSTEEIARFYSNVDRRGPDDCWLWTGYVMPKGYAQFAFRRRHAYAHRVAFILANGFDPAPLLVCHSCDVRYPLGDLTNRRCCNPSHLWAGTTSDNLGDMAAKGRSRNCAMTHPELLPRGDQNPSRLHPERLPRGLNHTRPRAIFSIEKVREIREIYARGGISQKKLAGTLGVSPNVICRIVNRKRTAFA